MKLDPIFDLIGEYPSILDRAARENWLAPLVEAHLTACDAETAQERLRSLLPALVQWTVRLSPNRRGRARGPRGVLGYRVFLPSNPGVGCRQLRVGIVLHEAAHVLDHLKQKKFSHSETYCFVLRRLVEAWAKEGELSAMKEIYDRHRGPFSLLLVREVEKKGGKMAASSDRVKGPMNAEEAHEEARMLVNDPRDNVTGAYVFSETEDQFIGAWYRKGERYAPWEDEIEQSISDPPGRVVGEPAREVALLSGGDAGEPEPVPAVDDFGEQPPYALKPGAAEPREPVSNVRPKAPRPPRSPKGKPGDRFPTVRGRALTLTSVENWPQAPGPQTLREWLIERGGTPATSAEIVAALGETLKAQGVTFPGSMISRLKQAGLLQVAPAAE